MIKLEKKFTRNPHRFVSLADGNKFADDARLVLTPLVGEHISKAAPNFYGNSEPTNSELGFGVGSSGGNTDGCYYKLPDDHPVFSITNTCTIFFVANLNTLTATHDAFMSIAYRSSGWTNPYGSLIVGADAGGVTNLKLFWAASASSTQSAILTNVLQTGEHSYAISRPATGNVSFYRDGELVGTATPTGTSSIDWGEKRNLNLFNNSETSKGGGYDGEMVFAYINDKAYTYHDIKALHNDYFQVYESDSIAIPRAGVAVGGTTSPWYYYAQH